MILEVISNINYSVTICLKYRLGISELSQLILLKFTFCSDFTEFNPKYTLVLFDFFYNILTSIPEFQSSSSKSGKSFPSF